MTRIVIKSLSRQYYGTVIPISNVVSTIHTPIIPCYFKDNAVLLDLCLAQIKTLIQDYVRFIG